MAGVPTEMAERIRYSLATQVAEAFPEAAGDIGEVPDGVSPLEYIEMIGESPEPMPAVIFTALALAKRESVWWGCLCLRGMGYTDPMTLEGLRLAEAWCKHPEEDERRAAGLFAEENYFEGVGAWIAFAAFTTSGSLAPAGLQSVPPSPEISGKSVAMAVLQATTNEDWFVQLFDIRCALASAKDFAQGGDGSAPWHERVPGTRAEIVMDDDDELEETATA